MNILFVCTGNTCRSPMAEAVLKDKASDWNVKSAGVFAQSGSPISPQAIEVLQRRNIEFVHKSQPVDPSLIEWAHYVLTMTRSHKESLKNIVPRHADKYFTLKEFIRKSDIDSEAQLKQKISDFEEKKAQFLKDNQNLKDQALSEAFSKQFLEEYTEICSLQEELENDDISDPFGGTVEMYEATIVEIERAIAELIEQLEE